MQKTAILLLAFTLTAGCRNSEVADAPAAEVQQSPTTDSAAPATSTAPTQSVDVVKEKSSIKFVGSNPVTSHEGTFQQFSGKVHYAAGAPQQIEFDVDTASVKTDAEKLDGHLKSPDFFDVAKFPKATFRSTSITAAPAGAANGATHEITGLLNMHGVEKSIKVPATVTTTADGVHARAEFTVDRNDWGIVYKGAPDKVIKDEVLMKIDLHFPPAP